MLTRYAEKKGLKLPTFHVFCTHKSFIRNNPSLPSGLTDVAKAFRIRENPIQRRSQFHNALVDTEILVSIYQSMCKNMKAPSFVSVIHPSMNNNNNNNNTNNDNSVSNNLQVVQENLNSTNGNHWIPVAELEELEAIVADHNFA